ncbi:copper-binding protein, partial [Vibrio parahaemolyticus]|nr:copper-binding protein [Vibrio parahaemolyticus]MDG2678191.1 copper-binding protein [Vibrio parahaemolyticus]
MKKTLITLALTMVSAGAFAQMDNSNMNHDNMDHGKMDHGSMSMDNMNM